MDESTKQEPTPSIGVQRVEQPSRTVTSVENARNTTATPPLEIILTVASEEEEDEEEAIRREEEKEIRLEKERKQKLCRMADTLLVGVGQRPVQLKWTSFLVDASYSSSEKFDLILSSLFLRVDGSEMIEFPKFYLKVMKPGSFSLLIVSHCQYNVLEEEFGNNYFKTLPNLFQILYSRLSCERHNFVYFPQTHGEIAIIIKPGGQHPKGFIPDFTDHSVSDQFESVTRYGSVTTVPICRGNFKDPSELGSIRADEKSVELFSFALKVSSPHFGNVLYQWAGTLVCFRAALDIGVTCVALEEYEECFQYTLAKLIICIMPDESTEHMEDYVGVDPCPEAVLASPP